MSSSSKPGDEHRNLPDDIALAAGMPRGQFGGSPADHTADLRDQVQDLRSTAGEKAGELGERAGQTAGDLRDRASDALDAARERAGDTADDLRARAEHLRSRAQDTYRDARGWVSDARETGRQRVDDLSDRGAERFQDGKSAVEAFVSENPLLVGVVGVAAGLLLGALLPRTRSEDRTVGPWADEVRDQGLRYARDVTSRGRDFVASALDPDNLNAAVQRAAEQTSPSSDTSPRSAPQGSRPH